MKLILITNDDGVSAKGLASLIEAMLPLGQVVVVAPDGPRSAQSSALTVTMPIRTKVVSKGENLLLYQCNGTPADCVKIALHQLLDRTPDLIVSGINHGVNSSISVIYSGTMGAAIEGCIDGVASIGFSLNSFAPHANFSQAILYARAIAKKVLEKGLPRNVCLNVNFPETQKIEGVKICRQADGYWEEEFEKRQDPMGKNYYWLTGHFVNSEPTSDDTDEAALAQGYISVVPVKVDMTAYEFMNDLNQWTYELE